MGKKSKKIKSQYLEGLSNNLRFFYPKLTNIFICPVCFEKISIEKKHKISEAHIIPQAAGGNIKTYICKKCNSFLGSKQDKWFGELIRLVETKENIVQTRFKDNYFYLCDKKVGGKFEYSSEKGMEVLIRGKKTPPEINDWVLRQFKKEKHKTFSFSLPILSKQRMISIGYLTAAYLLFFATFGYSWVLQSCLDVVRKQILNPDEKIIENIAFSKTEAVSEKSWIGVVQISGLYALAGGFSGYMVILPPLYCKNIYLKLSEIISKSGNKPLGLVGFYPMYFTNRHFYDSPVRLMFDNKIMFAPDAMVAGKLKTMTIYFSGSDTEAKFLFPISDEQYQKLALHPEAKKRKVKLRGKSDTKYYNI